MRKNPELTPLPGVKFSVTQKQVIAGELLLLAENVRRDFNPNRDRTGKTWVLSEINGQTTFEIGRRVVDNSVVPPVITTESATVNSPEGQFYYRKTAESNGKALGEPEHLSVSAEAANRIALLIRTFSGDENA